MIIECKTEIEEEGRDAWERRMDLSWDPSQYTGGTDPCHASMSLQNFGTERGQKIDVSMKMEAK